MRGSALVTTVLESIATNIASSSPLSASSTWRCVICASAPAGAGATGAGGTAWVTDSRFTLGLTVDLRNLIPAVRLEQPAPTPDMQRPAGVTLETRAVPGGRSRATCGSGSCLGFASSVRGTPAPSSCWGC